MNDYIFVIPYIEKGKLKTTKEITITAEHFPSEQELKNHGGTNLHVCIKKIKK